MGPLRLQNECDIYAFKKKTRRLNKAQRRHLFLFDGGLLLCKKRSQPLPYASEYYEHKFSIPVTYFVYFYNVYISLLSVHRFVKVKLITGDVGKIPTILEPSGTEKNSSIRNQFRLVWMFFPVSEKIALSLDRLLEILVLNSWNYLDFFWFFFSFF